MEEKDTELTQQHTADSPPSSASTNTEDKHMEQAGDKKKDHTGERKAPETITEDYQAGEPKPEGTNTEDGGDDMKECSLPPKDMDIPNNATSQQKVLPKEIEEKELDEHGRDVEKTDIEEDTDSPGIAHVPGCDENKHEDTHTGERKAPQTTTQDNHVDGPKPEDTLTENGGDDMKECSLPPKDMDIPNNASSLQTVFPKESGEKELDEHGRDVEKTDIEEDTDSPGIAHVPGCDENKHEDAHTGERKAPQTTTQDNHVDGPKPEDTHTEDGGDDMKECSLPPQDMDIPNNATSLQTVLPKESEEKELDEHGCDVEKTDIEEDTDSPGIAHVPGCDENKHEEDHAGEMKAPEKNTHLDGPKPEDTNTEDGGDAVSSCASTNGKTESDNDENMKQAGDARKKREKPIQHVETIGPTEPTDSEVTGILAGRKRYFIAVTIVVVFAMLVQYLLQPEAPPQIANVRQIDIFLRHLEKVKTQFPNQRAELWNRSRIHLQRHLQTAQPTEPVSLILTAGIRAERTLYCLAKGLAFAFSSALNASVLHIDGASKASQDSDKVKLDIDEKLQGAFEGDKPVAVIHRFEELPPGSTLIFYRYCDHENAAFKKTFLIFTVLLGDEEAIPAKIRLSEVEEMVDDYLQKKFLSHGPVSFDKMDLDKYGGLWSRISHLILPVASEEKIKHDGCKWK